MTRIRKSALSQTPVAQASLKPKALPPPGSGVLTIRECVSALAEAGVPICGYTLRKRIADGTIPATKTPYRVLVRSADLERFITRLQKGMTTCN